LEEGEIDELAEEKEDATHHHVPPIVLDQRHDLPADTDDDIYL
jgi:hypothetical protein